MCVCVCERGREREREGRRERVRVCVCVCFMLSGRHEPIPFELKDDNMGLGRWSYEVRYHI